MRNQCLQRSTKELGYSAVDPKSLNCLINEGNWVELCFRRVISVAGWRVLARLRGMIERVLQDKDEFTM